jgi:hypothetical protein
MWWCGLDRVASGKGQVAGTCECCNEPSGYVKFGKFVDLLPKKSSAPWSK